jgi:hypothetical protein
MDQGSKSDPLGEAKGPSMKPSDINISLILNPNMMREYGVENRYDEHEIIKTMITDEMKDSDAVHSWVMLRVAIDTDMMMTLYEYS